MAKRKPAGEQAKGLTLTIRISPKSKFVMELLARKQRRTVSAVIEWLAMQAADETFSESVEFEEDGVTHTVKRSLSDLLWDVDEVHRLINLAGLAPELMTYDEELIWSTIRNEPCFWLENAQELFFPVRDGETDMEIMRRISSTLPDTNRYRLFAEDVTADDRLRITHWVDSSLVRKAFQQIKQTANQEITPAELHRIVEELKDGIEIQQTDAPGVPKTRSRKKDQ
jgi:hypothetical protein